MPRTKKSEAMRRQEQARVRFVADMRYQMRIAGVSPEQMMRELGMCKATLYNRMADPLTFKVSELANMAVLLKWPLGSMLNCLQKYMEV